MPRHCLSPVLTLSEPSSVRTDIIDRCKDNPPARTFPVPYRRSVIRDVRLVWKDRDVIDRNRKEALSQELFLHSNQVPLRRGNRLVVQVLDQHPRAALQSIPRDVTEL